MAYTFENKVVKIFKSTSGRDITIRYLGLSDVEKLTEYINEISRERTFIGFQGEQVTLDEERAFLVSELEAMDDKQCVHLVVCDGDTIIGSSRLHMQTRIEKHIGIFGLSLHKNYRGQGIGRTLMNEVIEEAKKNIPTLEIITLGVFAHNDIALRLYKSMGFVQYGMIPDGVKLPDGYADHVYMYKRVR